MTQLMVLDCRQMSRTSFGRRSIASVRASAVDARVLCVLGQTQHTRLKEEGRFWTSTFVTLYNVPVSYATLNAARFHFHPSWYKNCRKSPSVDGCMACAKCVKNAAPL